jgi:hypothetical protein
MMMRAEAAAPAATITIVPVIIGWALIQLRSNAGTSGRLGKTPSCSAQISRLRPITTSKSVSATSPLASAGKVAPCTRRRSSTSFTASPARPGAMLLTPTPAQ